MAKQTNLNVNVSITNVNVNADPAFDREKRRTLAVLTAIAGLGGGVITSVLGNLAMPRVNKLIGAKELTPNDDVAGSSPPDHAHAALIYTLFLGSEALKTQYLPPTDWKTSPPDILLENDQYTYGHEAEVLRSISRFLRRETLASWVPTTLSARPDPHSSHVLLGSGVSNRLTRKLIGVPWKPQFDVAGVKLPYTITKGDGTILPRLQYGKLHQPPAHAVCGRDEKSLLQPHVRDGRQQDDFLLVTRIPGRIKGTILTIFSGLHGPGTRAAELLFTSVSMRAARVNDFETLRSEV